MRRISVILIPVLLVLALVLGVTLWRVSDALPGLGRIVGTGAPAIGGPFTLTDQDGRTRT